MPIHRLLAEYPLDALLQTIPTGLFLVDTKQKVVYWNGEAERLTGYSAAEALGQHCSFLSGLPCGKFCGLFNDQVKKPVIGVACTIRHKDGRRVELTKNVNLLRDKSGKVLGGIEAFIDLSQQKQQEGELRRAVADQTSELQREKASLRAVLDGMVDPAYICDSEFRITFINRAMREISGEAVGERCYQIFHGRQEPCESCPLQEVLEGAVIQQERRLEATGRTYEIVHSPYPTSESPSRKLGVFRDITERKEAEKRLQQANRELDAFVSTVSHDLRSPLTPLIGFAELLEERYSEQLDLIGQECLAEIKKTAHKMEDLLEDLLALARVGQLKDPDKPVDTTRLVEDVKVELADKIVKYQARVTIGRLPQVLVPEPLLADLFRNLLANALYYAAEYDPRIEIVGKQLPDRVQFRVIDHGPGVPENEREEIFEPFKRGSSGAGRSGTGIGLATVAKIARLFKGSTWLEETPGGGATMIVEIASGKE